MRPKTIDVEELKLKMSLVSRMLSERNIDHRVVNNGTTILISDKSDRTVFASVINQRIIYPKIYVTAYGDPDKITIQRKNHETQLSIADPSFMDKLLETIEWKKWKN